MALRVAASSVRSRARREGSERSSYPGSGGAGAGVVLAGGAAFAAGAVLASDAGLGVGAAFAAAGFAVGAALAAGAGFAVALAAGFGGLAASAGFAVAVALAVGAVFVLAVAFVAAAVFVAVAGQLGDGPAGPGPAGWSGVQTCSAALVLTLSAVSRSWPIPAKTARNTTTGASLMRSLTCGIGMMISP